MSKLQLEDLVLIFNYVSSFDVRQEKGITRDGIFKGMYFDEFLREFDRKVLKEGEAKGWLTRTSYRDPYTGSIRAAVLLTGYPQPQIDFWKRVLAREWPARRLARKIRRVAAATLLTAIGGFILLAIATALSSCSLYDAALPRANFKSDLRPLGDDSFRVTRFWDLEKGTLCYVVSYPGHANLAISCLPRE